MLSVIQLVGKLDIVPLFCLSVYAFMIYCFSAQYVTFKLVINALLHIS